jgi:hypothetical protein
MKSPTRFPSAGFYLPIHPCGSCGETEYSVSGYLIRMPKVALVIVQFYLLADIIAGGYLQVHNLRCLQLSFIVKN